MMRTKSLLAGTVALLAILSAPAVHAQDSGSAELKARYLAVTAKMEALKQRSDPEALVEQAQLLQDGVPVSETNPLKVRRPEEAERLYDKALAVPGAHWPSAAVRRAKLILSRDKDQSSIQKAMDLLRRAATMQNNEAAFLLAGLMESGAGGKRDIEAAKNLYQIALRSEHGPSGLALARLETDPAKSNVFATQGLRVLFQEARQGSAEAARTLADHYRTTGDGPERLSAAVEWYQRAVELGDAEAALRLGRLRADPKAPLRQPQEARKAFEKAAERGSVEAAMILAEDPYNGAALGVQNGVAELWLNRAIETKAPRALVLAAEIRSQYGDEGRAAAKGLLLEALQRVEDDVTALLALGRHVRDGVLIDRDVPLALKLFDKAAISDNTTAYYEFARTALSHQEAVTEAMLRSAIDRLRTAAERGHVKATVAMGDALMLGQGVPASQDAAMEWYRRAAESGSPVAYIRLGDVYAGRSAGLEAPRALEWYRKAAEANSAIAMVRLGKMFNEGRGVPQDQALAATWFSRAAAAGSGAAMVELSSLYSRAGGPGHFSLARDALEKAIRAGDTNAHIALAKLYLVRGERTLAEMTLKKSADSGNAEAALSLAELYLSGQATVEQQSAARRWLAFAEKAMAKDDEQASRIASMYLRLPDAGSIEHGSSTLEALVRKNNAEAMTLLATALLQGGGVQRDPARAEALFRRAIQLGHDRARFILAKAYRDGDGLQRDPTRAFALYREIYSEEPGDTKIQIALGDAYARGDGVDPDRRLAAEFYAQAARQGDPDGQVRLGTAYLYGAGVDRDSKKSDYWFSRAGEAGVIEAKVQLGSAKLSGLAATVDAEGAFASYLRAAEAGSQPAMIEVARALMKGFGTLADPALAKVWLERAASLGSPDAMFELHRLHDIGTRPNAREAERWLKQAAQSGHAAAMYRLAVRHRQGTSEQDKAAAREWLEKAAQAGHSQAAKALQKLAVSPAEPG
ncbi:tetratricopeptide repeat protein [Microvirga splendida]|uniref:SEL1-like repeat protein n=1 Tax=Microvirga splendida TaxID=2795727 RepID=A0ABS0XX84_9HYPH|nr:tetratricopeptide repeat protein [Microvirga splendida]MBJ6124666.1 SEL1-like repeat protein [Microvirga splendida]